MERDDEPQLHHAEDDEALALAEVLGDGLVAHASTVGLSLKARHLACVIRDEGGEMVAGASGNTLGTKLYIARVWVADTLRGRGVGARLVLAIEQRAAERGCSLSFLSTFAFQARAFYEKLGYETFAELDDPDPNLTRYYMKKPIGASHEARTA